MRVWSPALRRAHLNTLALILAPALGVAACSASGPPAGRAAKVTEAHPTGASGSGSASARGPLPSVTIAAVGDTMLGNTPGLPPGPERYFGAVRRELGRGAQIVFGNLEGTLTTATASKCGPVTAVSGDCFAFRDPPGYVRYLKHGGFTILNDANNHSFDFGAPGQAQTVRTIHAAGLAQTGLPGEITVVKARGARVAFLGFAPYGYDASLLDIPAARALITRAAAHASVVVVYMHAGAEGATADHVTAVRFPPISIRWRSAVSDNQSHAILVGQLLPPKATAKVEGCGLTKVYERLNNGEYDAVKDGNRTKITGESILRRRAGLVPYLANKSPPPPRKRGRRRKRSDAARKPA